MGDFELGNGHNWEIEQNDVDLTFYPKQLNCFDASCIELALRCKLERPGDVTLSAVTVSNGDDLRFFKPIYALGADRCLQISSTADLRFAPASVAAELAAIAGRQAFDWLLFGSYQSIGQNGATGILTAHALNLPCYTGVMDFCLDGDGLCVTYRVDDALLTETFSPPGVLVLDDRVTTLLRTPTMKQRLTAGARAVLTQDGGQGAPLIKDPLLERLGEEHTEHVCEMVDAQQLARRMLALCRKEGTV